MKVLIIDNYDSFTYNLYQQVAGITQCIPDVFKNDEITFAEIVAGNYDAIIISPGPGRPDVPADFGVCADVLKLSEIPVLGICLGHQGIAYFAGAEVNLVPEPYHGRLSAIYHTGVGLFKGLPQGFSAIRYHSLLVSKPLPAGLIDTAGIREATDAIERIGVERTMEKISQSALLVYVYDAADLTENELKSDLQSLQKPGINILVVANKIDLLNTQPNSAFNIPQSAFLSVSAKEKQHIDALKQKIYDATVSYQLTGDETLVTNIRHLEALQKTGSALARVISGIDQQVTSDFLAMDIKQALHYLGEITGAVTTDDLLDNIFSKFCIGK